ncbi:hypothetical protein BGZ92_011696 [Podila epicladia]|nr:hypothetical protein BGZ92_011696 [Podila epicladia]
MSTIHLSLSQTTALAIAFSVAIFKITPPGVSAANYFLANKHVWFLHTINDTMQKETHLPEDAHTPRSMSSSPSEHGSSGTLPRWDEEAYKRQLGNMKIKMELLISQHQVEMQNLRCQLEATGRKRKKRLALARGGEDESTMEPEPSQMKDQSQKVALGDRVSNSIADHNTEIRNAFVVLKNMSLLQHNVHLLSVGRDQKRWMLSHSGHENMVLAAISSMCIIIGVLTGSVVTAVNNLMEAQTTAQMGELDASLERYRTHMNIIQGELL